jgi:hypothetical protein
LGTAANAPVTSIVRGTSATSDVFIAAGGGVTADAPNIYKGTIDGNSFTALASGALAADLATQAVNVKGDAGLHYDSVVRLASGPSGTIVAAVAKVSLVNGDTKASLSSIYLSNNNGANWTKLANVPVAQINTGAQALTNLSIAVDPNDKKTVYVAGDSSATADRIGNFYLPIYKITLNADNTTTTVTDISVLGTDNSFIHPDARGIAFDKDGNLIVLNDGGIYVRAAGGTWHGLNGTLQLGEYYQVAYDSKNKRVGAAAQDNGVQLQLAANAGTFALVAGGDGFNISFADRNGANTYL